MTYADIIIPTRHRHDRLNTLLRCLDHQRLENNDGFAVIIAFDGDRAPHDLYQPVDYGITTLDLPRVGISAAKNRAVAASRADVLLLLNDDIEPAPDFVHHHLAAQRSGHPIVLGDTPFKPPPDPTLLDVCLARTEMIFSYASLRAGRCHGFRTAWNLNLSVRRDLLTGFDGPFDESLRPFMYEDIELAHRLIGERPSVYFCPAARALHDHRYSIGDYFVREAMLGVTAPLLAAANPDCFRTVFGQPLDRLMDTAKQAMPIDLPDARRTLSQLTTLAVQPCDSPGTETVELFYRAHLPLKRRAFRCGLLATANNPRTHWTRRYHRAAQALRDDVIFGSLASPPSPAHRNQPLHDHPDAVPA